MPMLESNSGPEIGSPLPPAAFEQQQRRRMLIALGVLVLALISVLIKDRQFWFPSSASVESETPELNVPQAKPVPKTVNTVTPVAPPKPVPPAAAHSHGKTKRRTAIAAATEPHDSTSPVITATDRAVLPPLEVEVVAGNEHRAVRPADSSVKLDMQSSSPAISQQTAAPVSAEDNRPVPSHAAARFPLSPGSARVVSRVDPSYPLLAKQMKVQGAVILEALIGKTGSIQDIQVLSGPAILSEAAREAVKQWHFKPYYQGGRAVETEARITVNFTISTY